MKMDSVSGNSSRVFKGLRFLAVFIVFLFLTVVNVYSQTHTSKNNYSGNWFTGSTWVSGTSPGNFPNASTFNIYGYVRIESGGLTINNNSPTINIYDTLYITGDFRLGQGSFIIHPGGLLIVTGSFYAENGLNTLTNNGNMVVKGNMSVTNGKIVNNSNLYVFGSTPVSGGGKINGCDGFGNPSGCNPRTAGGIGNSTDLANNNSSLSNFVNNLGVLPIQLFYFYLEKNSSGVTLHWATTSELNFDRFIIEKTRDGRNFVEVGSRQGAGLSNSRIDYSFTDDKVLLGRTYYRLKAIDFDGYTEYFGVVTANYEGAEQISVAPNPANGSDVKFQLNYSSEDALYYRVLNASGVEVYSSMVRTDGFDHEYVIGRTFTSGLYFLVVQQGQERKMVRFVVY